MLSSTQILTWHSWKYNLMAHWGFVNIFWLAGDVIILSCPITYCWKQKISPWSLLAISGTVKFFNVRTHSSATYVQQQSILALKGCHMMWFFKFLQLISYCLMCNGETVFLFKCKNSNISCSVSGNNHAWIHWIIQQFSESLHHQIS